MPSYPAGITVSNHALITLSDALRHRRTQVGTRWRRLTAGEALLVLAHLRKGETYADLGVGFEIGTTTVFRYLREALDVLATLAPSLHEAVTVATGKAFVIEASGRFGVIAGPVRWSKMEMFISTMAFRGRLGVLAM